MCLYKTFHRHKGTFKPSKLFHSFYRNELDDLYNTIDNLTSSLISEVLKVDIAFKLSA